MGFRDSYTREPRGLYFDAFRDYTEKLKAYFSGIIIDETDEKGDGIPVIWATPERFLADKISKRVEGQIDIPIFSLFLSGIQYRQDRQYLPSSVVFNTQKIITGPNPTDVIYRRIPKAQPWDLTYNLTLWAKYYGVIGRVDWNILTRFTPSAFINANGGPSRITLESVNDNSEIEPGENEERILRKDYTLKVEGWLPLEYTEVSSIIASVNAYFTDNEDFEVPSEESDEGVNLVEDFEITHKINRNVGVYISVEDNSEGDEKQPLVPQVIVNENK